jgi:hypothetical protein
MNGCKEGVATEGRLGGKRKKDTHALFGMFGCVLLIGLIPTILVEALSKRKVEAPGFT